MSELDTNSSMYANGKMTYARTVFWGSLEDFELLEVVRKGEHFKTIKAQHRFNSKLYALKTIRKDLIVEKAI